MRWIEDNNNVSSNDQRVQRYTESFIRHVETTSLYSFGKNISAGLKVIKNSLSEDKQDNVFSDYFDFTRKYFESVSSLHGVGVKKTTNTDGSYVLFLEHSRHPESYNEPTVISSIALTEIPKRDYNPNEEELYCFDSICNQQVISDFIGCLDKGIESINEHFGGNHGQTILYLFRELVKSKASEELITTCFISNPTQTGDPFQDYGLYVLIYRKYCDKQKRTVYCRLSLTMKYVCFAVKPIVH